MKKNILIFLSLFFTISTIFAQNIDLKTPPSFQFENILTQPIQTYQAVLQQDIASLLAEDMERNRDGQPMRIAVGIEVHLELNNTTAPLTRLASGEQIRRQTINSPGAYGLILTFAELFIPEGGKLFVYTANHKQIVVFTHETNPSGGAFATTILRQDNVILEYVESTVSEESARILVLCIVLR